MVIREEKTQTRGSWLGKNSPRICRPKFRFIEHVGERERKKPVQGFAMDTFGREKEGKLADLEVGSWRECAWKDTDDGTFLLGRLLGS